jgi:hypothetical protein
MTPFVCPLRSRYRLTFADGQDVVGTVKVLTTLKRRRALLVGNRIEQFGLSEPISMRPASLVDLENRAVQQPLGQTVGTDHGRLLYDFIILCQ